MRLKLLLVCSICLLSPEPEHANTWMPCMPFCDTMCTGVAALGLSSTVASSYGSLASQMTNNIGLISNLNASVLEQQASIFSTEYLTSQRRVTAYDGVAKTASLSVDKLTLEAAKLSEHLVTQSLLLQKHLRIADLASENGKRDVIKSLDLVNNSLSAAPALAKEFEENKVRAKEAVFGQIARSKYIGDNNINIQKQVVLDNIDFDLPNPFTADELDVENWQQYQDLLFLTFNAAPYTSETSLPEKRRNIKRQIALSIISKIWSETVTVNEEREGTLGLLVNNTSTTLKAALFDQYKQEMLNIDTQTNIKTLPKGSLLLVQTLQLAQKNLLLKEIADIKKLKNTLLALNET